MMPIPVEMMSGIDTGSLLTLAQLDAEDVELTAGAVIAGFLVLSAFAGSLMVLSLWYRRWRSGQAVIPAANRQGTVIPIPILTFGLLVAVFMSSLAILASIQMYQEPARPVAAGSDKSESVEPESEMGHTESATDNSETAGTDSDHQAEPIESVELDESPSMSPEAFTQALIQTVYLDLILVVVLGVPVWLLNREQQRRSLIAAQQPVALQLEGELLSLSPKGGGTDHSNSYRSPPDSTDELSSAVSELEDRWEFVPEFRFAAEACLAAYLPTAALRLMMVLLLQDDAQHPFLQMMDDGVSTGVLLLIAGTAVFLAPLMEELLYRVVILGGLLNARAVPTTFSTVVAIGLTSVLFAFAHGFPDSLALLPLAAVICWTYHQRRSYRTVVLVHFLFNGFNIMIAGFGML